MRKKRQGDGLLEPKKRDVNIYRGSYLESTHDIHAAVVDGDDQLLYSYGDPQRLTFARSSMKPFQAVPLVETGAAEHYAFVKADLALASASHSGASFHRSGVQSILDHVGLPEDALQCGTHIPQDHEGYEQHIRAGGKLTPAFSNCSGKHAGMLTTAVYRGEDPATYRDAAHPVQQRIIEAIADICDTPQEAIALSVDGCGVPVHRLPLQQSALGFARLARPQGNDHARALETIRDAMMAHPAMVAGTGRFDTDLMAAFNGQVVAKGGAEGVQCMGVVDQGIGIILKVEDGGGRAASAAAMEILKQLDVVDEAMAEKLQSYVHPAVKNIRDEAIGHMETNFQLERK